jgi:hypothetical protein
MRYTNKLQTDAVTGRPHGHMAARARADDRDSATEPELYLPAGITSPVGTSRIERLWGRLFDHGVEPPK